MRQLLKEYLNRESLSVNKLSSLAEISQPTLSRFMTGRTKTVTPEISKVLTYACIDRELPIKRITLGVHNSSLRAALERNWDGTAEGAVKLAVLIDAMGPLLRSMRLDSSLERSK